MFHKFPRFIFAPVKKKIIHKATELFLKLGFKSVTMDDIAGELGISKKTIYTHFKNKTALVKQCTFSMMENITEGIDRICLENKNPIEELFDIKKFVMNRLDDDQYSPQYQLQKYYPDISDNLQTAQFDKMLESTKTNIEKGKAQGLYRQQIDADFIARLYFLGITGMKDQNLFPPLKFPTKYITDEYLEYHLRAIVTEEGLKTLNRFIKENQPNDQ